MLSSLFGKRAESTPCLETCGTARVVPLGGTVVWLCHPGASPSQSWAEDTAPHVQSAIEGLASSSPRTPPPRADAEFLLSQPESHESGLVKLIKPEESVDMNYCQWDGDGHFNMKGYPGRNPPTLGQIVRYLQKLDEAVAGATAVVHLTSQDRRATGAVLAGAVMVLAQGMTAEAAWAKILRGCPAPSTNPAEAWDRFSSPFSPTGATGESSLTVLDCLSGLEAARRLGWLEDYKTFDVEAWRFLRRKFDASWLIPGEMIAFGDPQLTAQNPRFPGLLLSPTSKEKGQSPMAHPVSECDLSNASTATSFSVVEENEEATPLKPFAATPVRPFSAPAEQKSQMEYLQKDSFASLFLRMGIRHIVRLNYLHECKQEINCPTALIDINMKVGNYEFKDGSVPGRKTLRSFVSHCERAHSEGLAVHCKAGLGRTGIMVGAYAVENYDIDGKAFHGWVRLARPGSVQTPEQERFLRSMKAKGGKMGGCLRMSI